MFRRVFAIALNTYRESVRARILIGLAGVAFCVAFYALIVGAFTLKNAPRVVSDLGSASISIFSIGVAIIIAATSLHRELEQKTIFPILARPIRRGEYVVGKYLGTLLTLGVFIMADTGLVLLISASLSGDSIWPEIISGVLSIALFAVAAWRWASVRTYGPILWAAVMLVLGIWFSGGAPDERRVVLGSSILSLLEVGIVTAIATLFASFSTPFLSALLTFFMFIVGRNADALTRLPVKFFGQGVHDAGVYMAKIVPNLQIFVPPRPLLTGEAIDARFSTYLAMATLTGIGWSIGLLAVASFIFKKRDFL